MTFAARSKETRETEIRFRRDVDAPVYKRVTRTYTCGVFPPFPIVHPNPAGLSIIFFLDVVSERFVPSVRLEKRPVIRQRRRYCVGGGAGGGPRGGDPCAPMGV